MRVWEFAKRLVLVLGLFSSLWLGSALAETGRRVALIIGNGHYQHVRPLENPPNDAAAMAGMFRDAGFTSVEAKTDLDQRALLHALADFEVQARDAEVAIVYYSGHGLEFGGQNYLVPIDAAIDRDVDVKDETVPLERVLEAVAGATRLKLVILDACRTDPFKATGHTRAVDRGLGRIEPSDANELVAYSARAGTVAQDGEAGHNSPYTAALLKRLTVPGLDIELALRRVRDDVLNATHHEQEPFYYGAMGGDELPLVAKPADPGGAVSRAAEAPIVAKLEAAPDPSIGQCDALAAAPFDATRPSGVAGVEFERIDAARAIAACRAAAALRPDEPRLSFQLGRALEKAGAAAEAIVPYRTAAEAGSVEAMNNLGGLYEYGTGTAKDPAEAARLYRKAAEAGSVEAMNNLGALYEDGRGTAQDPAEALRLYRKAADGGSAAAMNNLGRMYENGTGIAKDPAEALRLYRKAADAGNADAMNNLGGLYEDGRGTAQDPVEALRLYRTSAESGNAAAMNNLGRMYENGTGVAKDPAEASRWYRKAAEAGNSDAMNNLGLLDENGTGTAPDPVEAARLYRKAAEGGNADAMNNLGRMYDNGTGVAKNPAEALRWYRKAADAGQAAGMNSVGYFYEKGMGTKKDPAEAVRWYRRAAEAGNDVAMNNLGIMYEDGTGIEKNPVEAAHWYLKAAEAGNSDAMNNLGMDYEDGRGVERDKSAALRWYRKAADLGNDAAKANVMRLTRKKRAAR